MILPLLQLAVAVTPSFDCAKARSQVEHAICASPQVAELDREEARLYRLALALPDARRAELTRRQREFLEQRDSCPESSGPLEECLRDAYLGDIAELRRLSGLEDDNEGLSFGPNRFDCDADYPDVYVTVFGTEPEQAWLAIPSLKEAQPLAADGHRPERFVGRYATDMQYHRDTQTVQVGRRICTLPGG